MSTESNISFADSRAKGESLRSEPARWLHVVLLAVGLVGWMTFILACVGGPAWSPDSSKILFAWRDYEGGRYGVAVYNRATHKSWTVFQHLAPEIDDDSDFDVVPVWQNDGTRAIVAMTTKDSDTHCTLFSISLKGEAPPEAYDLGKKTMCLEPGSMPQIGTRVFIGGDDGITWLDLSTGETGSKTIDGGSAFVGEHNGQLMYTRGVSRPVNDPKDKDAKEEGLEFGRMKLDDLGLKPAFTLWASSVAGVDLYDAGTWEPGGSRIAIIGHAKDTDKILLLDENKGLTGTLTPELGGVKAYRFGNLVWSHDGKKLFASVITKGQGETMYDYSLSEIPLAGTRAQMTRIASFHTKKDKQRNDQADRLDFDGGALLSMQVSLSPDGSTIAATPANMDNDSFDRPDRALFLVDMRQPTHRVTRIPFPKAPKAVPQPARTAQ